MHLSACKKKLPISSLPASKGVANELSDAQHNGLNNGPEYQELPLLAKEETG